MPMKRPATTEDVLDRTETISIATLAKRWHIGRCEARRLVAGGELPFVEIRGQIRVPSAAIARHEQRWRVR